MTNRRFQQDLAASIQAMESGLQGVEGALQRSPARAESLRSHLELWLRLDGAAKVRPSSQALHRGRQRMLAAIDEIRGGERRMFPAFLVPAAAKVGAVVVGAALLTVVAAGASAALGGPNVADDVLSAVGITNDSESDRAYEGMGNGSEDAEQGAACADPRASEGANNTDTDADSASQPDDPQDLVYCTEGASDEGTGTATDKTDDRSGQGLDVGSSNTP